MQISNASCPTWAGVIISVVATLGSACAWADGPAVSSKGDVAATGGIASLSMLRRLPSTVGPLAMLAHQGQIQSVSRSVLTAQQQQLPSEDEQGLRTTMHALSSELDHHALTTARAGALAAGQQAVAPLNEEQVNSLEVHVRSLHQARTNVQSRQMRAAAPVQGTGINNLRRQHALELAAKVQSIEGELDQVLHMSEPQRSSKLAELRQRLQSTGPTGQTRALSALPVIHALSDGNAEVQNDVEILLPQAAGEPISNMSRRVRHAVLVAATTPQPALPSATTTIPSIGAHTKKTSR